MVFTGKSKPTNSNGSENWGMGLLLVFFQEDTHTHTAISSSNKLFSSSPSSIKRTNYSNLLTKAQSTITICVLLIFISLLLFTLSTFEPTIKTNLTPPRRFLEQKSMPNKVYSRSEKYPVPSIWFAKMWKQKPGNAKKTAGSTGSIGSTVALQGLGTLYMRGTRAMADLAVVHLGEDVEEDELRLFLRLWYRSGVTAKSDSVFIFPSPSIESRLGSVIQEESDLFLKLLDRYMNLNATTDRNSGLSFDLTQFVKVGKIKGKEIEEPLWGKRIKRFSNGSDSTEGKLNRLSYGSVVSFESAEIDPENSLSGFSDHIPMSLRRWACYPMLLGRVRRNFKHIMLLDMKNFLPLSNPLGRAKPKSTESVLFFKTKHAKKEKTNSQSHDSVNPAIIIGGARGVRRLSNAMLVEIARVLMQHKKKNSVTESGILSHLVNNEHILKNVNVITTTDESIPELSSLVNPTSNSVHLLSAAEHKIVQRGNYKEISSLIMKQICMSEIDSFVYSDC